MLQVSDLSINFGGRYLFDDVSFAVRPNDRIGLIGRNGTGKSTLLRIIEGSVEPESGTVAKPNQYKVGFLKQEIENYSDLPIFEETKSALTEIIELENLLANINKSLSGRQDYHSPDYTALLEKMSYANERLRVLEAHSIEAEIEKVLVGLGFLQSEFSKPYSQFSGGWQMRVELAKILLSKPECILLDEPTNHLDIESVKWLEGFLKYYPGSLIIVSHDRIFLDTITNRTFELVNGKIIDMPLSYSAFILARIKQKEDQLAAMKSQQRQIAETEKFIERFRSKATLATRVQSRVKALDKIERIEVEEEDVISMNLRFPEPPRSSRLVVETKGLKKAFGDKVVLSNVDFALERGEKIAFVGKNGEGKTTFSKILAGFLEHEGSLKLGTGVNIGYYAQHRATMLDGDATVFEIIDNAATGDMRAKVRSLLGAFLFSGDAVYKKVKVLSGGEKSRLALAKLLLEPINFLILDEPTNHLDMLAKDVLKNALLKFSGSMIIVSHDRDFLTGLTDTTYHFADKKIKSYMGGINEYLDKINLENLHELERKTQTAKREQGDTKSLQQIDRQNKKDKQREETKLKKQIARCEEEIAEIEDEIAKMDELFTEADFYADALAAKTKHEEYDILRNDLDAKLAEWEILGNELSEI